MSAGVVGVLAALAMLLALEGRPRVVRRPAARRTPERSAPRWTGRALAASAAGLGSALLLGGGGGLVVGAVSAAGVWSVVGRLEPSGSRRRREQLERQAPLVVDLVAACLASGATVEASVRAAAAAVGDPAASLLRAAVDASALGATASDAWRHVAAEEPLAGLARALVRSLDTGAPLGEVLPRLAARARARRAAHAEARVRTAAVRLTGPLGLAFLPAFVLLGVVPVVAAWMGALL